MPTTRCKVRCTEVAKRELWSQGGKCNYGAKFAFVSSGSDENKKFFEATPSGSLEVSTVREDHFEVGKEYYLDFTPAS